MKLRFSVIILLLVFSFAVKAQEANIELSGVYKGKNLYVQNPFAGNMKDFCAKDVFINGEKKLTNVQSSAFEVDLSHLKMGDAIIIKITHLSDCKPKILNPQVIRNDHAEFQFVSFNVSDKKIDWSTKGESSGNKMFVQQFTRGQWVNIKEITGKGLPTTAEYVHPALHHAGINKYRIKYLDVHGKVVYSHAAEFNSTEEDITFYPTRVTNTITLSRATDYEIMDSYGNVVKKGHGDKIDCVDLKTGVYYLNMHNQTEKFLKK